MRRFFSPAALILGLVLGGYAGSASALSVLPNPLNFSFGSGSTAVSGYIDFLPSSTSTQLDMQVTITDGGLSTLTLVTCETLNCGLPGTPNDRELSAVGTVSGPGVDVKNAQIITAFSIDTANYQFKNFPGGSGTSDVFYAIYSDPLQSGDLLQFALTYSKGKNISAGYAAATIPEPGTLLLLGLGLGGLSFAGRRPRLG